MFTERLDSEIKAEGLHLRFGDQLVAQARMLAEKIPRIQRDLNSFILFPDARREEAYISLVEAGEIAPESDGATSLSASAISRVESEYQDRLKFYQDKVDRLKMLVGLIAEEQGLRAGKKVIRSPIGTTYYVDFENGNDLHDGTHPVETDSNEDGPWATLTKVGTNLNDPDKAVVRRGMTQVVSADWNPTNDGTLTTPIIVEADYDDTTWTGGKDEVTAGETATLIFGSKTVTFAGDISASIAAHKWIYVSGEDNRELAYEVESVSGGSNEIVTLYLPYKGVQAGSGKTIKVMLANPIWNIVTGDYQFLLAADEYWMFQGLHLRSTDGLGVVKLDSIDCIILKDCIIEANGDGDLGLKVSDDWAIVRLYKCRLFNCDFGIIGTGGSAAFKLLAYDCLVDGNNVSGSAGIVVNEWDDVTLYDCELKNHAAGDIQFLDTTVSGNVRLRNCTLSSGTQIDQHNSKAQAFAYSEDHHGVVGDNRQLSQYSVAEGTPIIQSETTKVRAGGGTTSIKCTPSDNLGVLWEFSKVKLFEYPIYLVKDVAKTFTVYFSSDDDTDWDADPLNTELWIEAEYWGHATNKARRLLKSTGVCNNFDADDTIWDTLTVTITPLQTGVAYLRAFYCKTKEAVKSNIFYTDTKIGIA